MKKAISILIFFPFFCLGQWNQVGNSINGQNAGDSSGYSTAISADGSIVAIGSNSNDNGGNSSGQVRVFGLSNGTWSQIGADLNGESVGDQTGQSVSLSDDGSVVAIGEPLNNDLGFTSGQVRVFRNVNNTWTQVGQDLFGNETGAFAGRSVDLSADGSTVAFGAPDTAGFIGKVKVFQLQGNTWVQKGQDLDGDGSVIKYGEEVKLSADGNTLAVSQTGSPFSNPPAIQGKVRLYQFNGSLWVQVGSTIVGTVPNDEFGSSIGLSDSGTILAIGSNGNNQVKIFQLNNGNLTQLGNTLVGQNATDSFGSAVSLSGNGLLVAVGARSNSQDGTGRGRTYVFENQGGTWTQINDPISGDSDGDGSGFSVAISQNGSKVAITATGNDTNGSNAGHVRVFENTSLSTADFDSNSFTFYPNPSRDVVNFSSSTTIETITLYNVLGQEVFSKNIDSKEFSIDISKLSIGTYVAKLNSNSKLKTLKFIKI